MPSSINTNLAAIRSHGSLNKTFSDLKASREKLASGLRISRAAQGAAALAISEGMRADMRSFQQAGRNISDGLSMVRTADGAASAQSGILGRMRELAVQSSNGTISDADRGLIQTEFESLQGELDRIANVSDFNGMSLNDGSSGPINVQVGIQNSGADQITVNLADTQAAALGVDSGSANVASQGAAQDAISSIDGAIESLSTTRTEYGAAENRLSSAFSGYQNTYENLVASESAIRDVDVAAESANSVRNQILSQANVALLAQANKSPRSIQTLL